MANIFNALAEFVNKPNRNTFDMSFQNNLTMNFGTLYPVFCKEVIPGDSFRIRPTFGLRFMPLVFPIQTRMQANLHFFYVRNRNLWKDWPDFIGNTKKDLIPPYIGTTFARDIFKTGSLGDYLGVPTTLAGSYGSHMEQSQVDFFPVKIRENVLSYSAPQMLHGGTTSPLFPANASLADLMTYTSSAVRNIGSSDCTRGFVSDVIDLAEMKQYATDDDTINTFSFGIDMRPGSLISDVLDLRFHPVVCLFVEVAGQWRSVLRCDYDSDTVGNFLTSYADAFPSSHPISEGIGIRRSATDDLFEIGVNVGYIPFHSLTLFDGHDAWSGTPDVSGCVAILSYLEQHYTTSKVRLGFFLQGCESGVGILPTPDWSTFFGPLRNYQGEVRYNFAYLFSDYADVTADSVRDISQISRALNPYLDGSLKVSALPFRAYESIYNSFYRNQFNDPFMIDGQKEYNKFLRNTDGGLDNLNYELYNRNWELDFLTSARQSPVDGDVTPLVGVTGSGKFVFENEDGSRYTVTPVLGDDGKTLTGIDSIQGTPENNSGLRRLIDMASVGISINDFRNVNALQRWLETNLRRGYRYRDQIMSHFGVNVRYEELDMPEFIGGMSEPVLVNQVNQMSDQTDSPSGLGDFSKVLGSFAGQASILAQSKHEITKYCDEHGFIIGILSVSPVPNYSQLLPKHFIKNSVLDYYFPSFGHIGNQPITYREVCPLQSFAAGDSLDDVFGYQRAWYDYIASVDEVHGDFRTSLEGFLINRVFASRPELGKDFITIDKDSMSNPFSVTDETDKILGEVYFDVQAQRPIPKLGIPRLE